MGLECFNVGFAIIVGALLSSLICALTVSVVVGIRCRRLRAVLQPEIGVGVEGVGGEACSKMNLKALPAMVYNKESSLACMDCPICLVDFVEGEMVRVLPECSHIFHINCIDAWVVSRPSCPSCRQPLLDVLVENSSEEAQAAGNPRNESIHENHMALSSRRSVDDTTMATSSHLDCVTSNDLGGGNVTESCISGLENCA